MAVNITFDNDRTATGTQNLTLDESAGVQTTSTSDDGNEVDVTNSSGTIGGLTTVMNNLLNAATIFGYGSFALSAAQKAYIASVDGASSSLDFIKVEVTDGEVIDDLFFSDANGQPLNGDLVVGMQTLAGEPIYLWSNGDLAIATTSATLGGGRIVAVFCLHEDTTDHLEAQIQFVALEQLLHTNSADPDDTLNFTNILNVSASGSISFDFEELQSGSSLWVAVGNSSAAMLVTGGTPIVDGEGKKTNASDVIHTSQGGIDATIGVNNQLFDNVGETAVFTLVTGMDALTGSDDGAASDYIVDHTGPKADGIDYSGYINTTGAAIFLSQSQGNDPKNLDINLFSAGPAVEDGSGYIPGLTSDTKVAAETVTITDENGVEIGTWAVSASGSQFVNGSTHDGVTVTIGGNDADPNNDNNIDVNGVFGEYTIAWTTDGVDRFNRFSLVSEGGQFDVGRVDVDNIVGDTEAIGDNLLVDDAGPAIGDSAGGTAIANSTVQFTSGATSGAVALGDIPGTDGQKSLQITDYTPTLSILGKTIEGSINAAGTEVKYFEDLNNNDILDGNDVHWYTLSITQNATTGDSYTFTVVNAPAAPPLQFDFNDLPSGSNLFGAVADSADGPGLFVFGRDPVLNASTTKYTNASDVIHTSQGGIGATIGVNNQMFDAGEGAFFTFVDDVVDNFLAGNGGTLTATEADYGKNIQYSDGLHETESAFLGISQIQAGSTADLSLTAFLIDPNTAPQGVALINASGDPADAVDITGVEVRAGSITGALIESYSGGTEGGLDPDITISIDADGVAHISGLDPGMVVAWTTDGDHNQVLVEATGGKFDVGFFGFNEAQQTPDQVLNFEVSLLDGDNDPAVDTFSVTVDAVPYIV